MSRAMRSGAVLAALMLVAACGGCDDVASPAVTDWPVASARPAPITPVPEESERLPRTRAVSGVPVRIRILPVKDQSLSHLLRLVGA